MMNRFLFAIFTVSLFIVSCSDIVPSSPVAETAQISMIGTWVNVVDTIFGTEITLIENENVYDTEYIPSKPTNYWDTITFIDSNHCITGAALKDTQTYWFEDKLSTRWIVIRGLENHKWMGQTAFPFEIIGSCIIMKPFIYSRIN